MTKPPHKETGNPSNVAHFYETTGWATDEGVTNDARRYEDLRQCAQDYVRKCRNRVLRHIPAEGDRLLDVGSGPIQYEEYLNYSENFEVRTCVDLSKQALDAAKQKIGRKGKYICGDFLDVPLAENSFDCAISLHTIYHLDKEKQEEAVRKLLNAVRPGKPVIIVYTNPGSITQFLARPLRTARSVLQRDAPEDLYVYAHANRWWRRFEPLADVQILPWRSLPTPYQKLLVPDNALGARFLDTLFTLEDRFPKFFARFLQYPLIVLTKKPAKPIELID